MTKPLESAKCAQHAMVPILSLRPQAFAPPINGLAPAVQTFHDGGEGPSALATIGRGLPLLQLSLRSRVVTACRHLLVMDMEVVIVGDLAPRG